MHDNFEHELNVTGSVWASTFTVIKEHVTKFLPLEHVLLVTTLNVEKYDMVSFFPPSQKPAIITGVYKLFISTTGSC